MHPIHDTEHLLRNYNLLLCLDVSGNLIGDDGVHAILEALKTEHSLEKLRLSSKFPMFCIVALLYVIRWGKE